MQRGTLTVGVVQTVNAYLIPEIVSRFSTLHPLVVLKFDELSVRTSKRASRMDCWNWASGLFRQVSDRIESQLLFEEDFVVIAAPGIVRSPPPLCHWRRWLMSRWSSCGHIFVRVVY